MAATMPIDVIMPTARPRLTRHRGNRTRPSTDTTIIAAAKTKSVTSPLLFVVSDCSRRACAPAHDGRNDEPACQQHQRGPKPQQPGLGLDLRAIQHEFAVTGDQEILDLAIRLALPHQVQYFPAQVAGDLCVGVRQRLVLAHHAAQFGGEMMEARFLRAAGERQRHFRLSRLRNGQRRTQHQEGGGRKQRDSYSLESVGFHWPRSISASLGSTSSAMTLSVSGPVDFQRTTPLPSTRKVSGAPEMPQSIAALLSRSVTTIQYGLPNCSSQRSASACSSFQLNPTTRTRLLSAKRVSTGCSSRQDGHQLPQTLRR